MNRLEKLSLNLIGSFIPRAIYYLNRKSDFWFKRSANTSASNLTISTLIGDLSRFQLAIDRVKSDRIQTV